MLSKLASVDESRPGTLERIIRQASLCCLEPIPRIFRMWSCFSVKLGSVGQAVS